MPSLSNYSLIELIMNADPIVQGVMFLLLLCSIWCWAIIFGKVILIQKMTVQTENFEKQFWSGQSLDELFKKYKNNPDNPATAVFTIAMNEWYKFHNDKKPLKEHTLHVGLKERLRQSMNVAINRSFDNIQKNMGVLATVGSSAAFIGLFGTVWGVMNSFQSIAATKNTTLVVVAPGIAEALLATAFGLFAAIPAMVAYNLLGSTIGNMAGRVEDFSTELYTLLSRELEENK